jgi:hypothetical protein
MLLVVWMVLRVTRHQHTVLGARTWPLSYLVRGQFFHYNFFVVEVLQDLKTNFLGREEFDSLEIADFRVELEELLGQQIVVFKILPYLWEDRLVFTQELISTYIRV